MSKASLAATHPSLTDLYWLTVYPSEKTPMITPKKVDKTSPPV
jgi:hypothetical protein